MRGRLAAAQERARHALSGEQVGWVDPARMHLTLRFLGQTGPTQQQRLHDLLARRVLGWPAVSLELVGTGCFPDRSRPRVIWAGARDPRGALGRMAAQVEAVAQEVGFAPEGRPFSPHLTLGRVRRGLSRSGLKSLEAWLEETRDHEFGEVAVGHLALLRSDLRPAGPEYHEMTRFELGLPLGDR